MPPCPCVPHDPHHLVFKGQVSPIPRPWKRTEYFAASSASFLIANFFRTGRYPKVAAPLGRPARLGLQEHV
jgi:hypothetical protein